MKTNESNTREWKVKEKITVILFWFCRCVVGWLAGWLVCRLMELYVYTRCDNNIFNPVHILTHFGLRVLSFFSVWSRGKKECVCSNLYSHWHVFGRFNTLSIYQYSLPLRKAKKKTYTIPNDAIVFLFASKITYRKNISDISGEKLMKKSTN